MLKFRSSERRKINYDNSCSDNSQNSEEIHKERKQNVKKIHPKSEIIIMEEAQINPGLVKERMKFLEKQQFQRSPVLGTKSDALSRHGSSPVGSENKPRPIISKKPVLSKKPPLFSKPTTSDRDRSPQPQQMMVSKTELMKKLKMLETDKPRSNSDPVDSTRFSGGSIRVQLAVKKPGNSPPVIAIKPKFRQPSLHEPLAKDENSNNIVNGFIRQPLPPQAMIGDAPGLTPKPLHATLITIEELTALYDDMSQLITSRPSSSDIQPMTETDEGDGDDTDDGDLYMDTEDTGISLDGVNIIQDEDIKIHIEEDDEEIYADVEQPGDENTLQIQKITQKNVAESSECLTPSEDNSNSSENLPVEKTMKTDNKKEEKKRKKREKEQKALMKKFNLSGSEQPIRQCTVATDLKGSRTDLTIMAGDYVYVVKETTNIKGKWLCQNSNGEYGMIEIDALQRSTGFYMEDDDEIYADVVNPIMSDDEDVYQDI